MMPETLAGVNVGDVNFHSGNVRALDRIVQRNRSVRIGGGVEDDADRLLGKRFVDDVDELTLAVGLAAIGFQTVLRGGVDAELFDIGKRKMAVLLRLPDPKQIEVWTVEHIDRFSGSLGHQNPGRWRWGGPPYR